MCVDYRKLNAITIGDPYPLPHIEELINGIGASKFITTLDLTKGYHQVPVAPEDKDKGYYQVPVAPEHKDKGYYQVPVAPEDKEKTAFITPYGKYQFTTMPFGLVSAPSTFQILMDEFPVLAVFVYLLLKFFGVMGQPIGW